MLVANFTHAEKVIQHAIQAVHNFRFGIAPAPRVIMHQLEKDEGGITQVEQRVLRELALGAGAREVLIYEGTKIDEKINSYEKIKARISTAQLTI